MVIDEYLLFSVNFENIVCSVKHHIVVVRNFFCSIEDAIGNYSKTSSLPSSSCQF